MSDVFAITGKIKNRSSDQMALQTRNVLKRLFSYIFEEKTHLSSLLERVAKGEEIMIIRHGKPLAWLTRIDFAIAKLKAVRKNCTLDGIS